MSLPTAFDVTLEFLADWHIGTGQGRLGTIDAEVRRDRDGLPFVPAKTLIGVWRDACETVADTFDRGDGPPGAWQAWVTWLFGSQPARDADPTARAGSPPVPAALRLNPAHAADWLGTAVRGRPALAQAAVVLRPGVQIDDDTGTAADRLLRVEERAIRSLQLHTRVSVISTVDSKELPEPAELLLRAGARLVEALGGKRHRGTGRVAVLLPDVTLDTAGIHPTVTDARLVQLLRGGAPAAPPDPPPAAGPAAPHRHGRLHPGGRRTLRVVLRVVTPVVATDDVLGNVIRSRDTIPGTALLGTVLARLTPANGGGAPIGLADIAVGDAVPAVADPHHPTRVAPTQPAPVVWHRADKGRGNAVSNHLVSEPDRDQRGKPMDGRIVATDDGWRHVSTAFSVSTHAVVDDAARRPTVASGGVYTYLGIAPGTLLCTDIVLPADAALRLQPGEQLRFGRSRKDDFGLVDVVAVVDPLPPPAPPTMDTDRLRVWCVSDVLLHGERLTPDPSPRALAHAVSAALAPAVCQVVAAGSAGTAVRRDGFAVTWGRPRPSQVALRAGSVVTLTVTGPVDPGPLAALERDGIGERTAEGYGRIRFNPPELATARPAVAFPDADAGQDRPTGDRPGIAPGEPAHPIEINAWRRAIRRASAALDPDEVVPGITRLAGNRAQLGALRSQLDRLRLPDGAGLVRAWLAGTRAVRARRERWTEPVLDDLTELLLNDTDRIWERLGLHGPRPGLVLGPDRETLLRSHLHTEAVIVTLTDTLRHLTRDRRRRDPAGTGPTTAKAHP